MYCHMSTITNHVDFAGVLTPVMVNCVLVHSIVIF